MMDSNAKRSPLLVTTVTTVAATAASAAARYLLGSQPDPVGIAAFAVVFWVVFFIVYGRASKGRQAS